MTQKISDLFSLQNKVIVVTGGAGLLGFYHAEAITEAGGIPVLIDIKTKETEKAAALVAEKSGGQTLGLFCDITSKDEVKTALEKIIRCFGRLDGLVNNAANDPKFGPGADSRKLAHFENLSIDIWEQDLAVGLTGAFICSQIFGHYMVRDGGGVIVNIASDLAVIAPDQRIYQDTYSSPEEQMVKPVTYSVVKAGVVGLTKYLATYWAKAGIRVNSLSPGGVFNNQSKEFVQRLTNLIPMGRMAEKEEYKAALVFLLSDASSYMTGANLVIDGGRTCW